MHEVIHGAFDKKLEAFELLGTDEPWLHLWTGEIHQYVGIHLYPLSIRGLMNLGSESSGFILRRLPLVKNKSTKE